MQSQGDCNTGATEAWFRLAVPTPVIEVALLTGGVDRPYVHGLAMALARKEVHIDVMGSDAIDSPEMHLTQNITFLNIWPPRRANPTLSDRLSRTLRHYVSLLRYTAKARPRIFHILWNSKIEFVDRVVLMLYFKLLGKKIALTAHNVNQARRDGKDSALNRITLRVQYRLSDHIFVHTQKMKKELTGIFGVAERSVTVIRHPLNDAFPDTDMTLTEAKRELGLQTGERAILCLGRLKPYKGIEHLLKAFQLLVARDSRYRLIVAGEVDRGNEAYLKELTDTAALEIERGRVSFKTEFIPDIEMEVYLKAADVLVLPYNEIFQSGVLFLGYSFGLPVIATDVGSFREEIVDGITGYICRPRDPADLAAKIETYFISDLYLNRDLSRQRIQEYARTHHSWAAVADLTRNVYMELLRSKVAMKPRYQCL